jgi:O-antigen ligase
MIIEKPLFGHAPFKEFFYEKNMYSENEYILQTWRYGIIGLIIYLGVIFTPLYHAIRNKYSVSSLQLILMSLFVMVNSFTNTPFSSPTINLLFAIIIGFYFGTLKNPQRI